MASNALSMVGMANKAGRVCVGEEPCDIAVRSKQARLLLLASDAAGNTCRRCDYFAEIGNCLLVKLPDTKAELGNMLGRSSCAIVAVTDVGFAASIVKRLAASDSATYGEAAEKMELKAKRAMERRLQTAESKNIAQKKKEKYVEKEMDKVRKNLNPESPHRQRKTWGDLEQPKAKKPYKKPAAKTEDSPYRKAYRPFDEKKSDTPQRKPYTPGKSKNPYAGSRPVKKGKGSDK